VLEGIVPRPQGRDPPPHAPYRNDSYGGGCSWNDPYHSSHNRGGLYGDQPDRRYPNHDPFAEDSHHSGWHDDHDDGYPEGGHGFGPAVTPEQPPAGSQPRWYSLLPPTLQLALWCLRALPGSPGLLGALGIGAATAITAVAIGPLAGVVTAAAGAVVLLTSLADGVTDAAGDLASTLDR
jgi:hypothetical protein